ncbi:MAG TPA: tetratricopeptide repeat protein [Thermohalobaculum sp.]|nr:tetratricopeptide repeat protein [Thermohalobaculum sp.]
MSENDRNRRLAAIVATDVVGYSRMMGADEQGTLAALKALQAELIEPIVAEHGGRTVKLMGDGALIEFPSVINAVHSAIALQEGLAERNAGRSGDSRILLRIGVHLGDVIADGADIFGEGVNVAARLEPLAEPGGIAISGTARDSLDGQLAARFGDAGERTLKNIARPVRLWQWRAGRAPSSARAAVPERPSIAVLPFDNMSGDPDQVYLADGIAEDILTGLARVRWLVVTSRNSSFSYRDKTKDLRKVAGELGVRYVLEGSVRRAGERVRITAQLIDAAEDRHIWAERYDRQLADIFDLQDEITAIILGAIEPELGLAEQARARRAAPESLEAWDLYLRGQWHLFRFTAQDNAAALDHFRRAITLDPDFAACHAGLAYACHLSAIEDFSDDPAASIAEGVAAARRAVALDDKDAMAHSVLARILTINREHDAAVVAGQTAVGLNPNNAQVRFGLAVALTFTGRVEEAHAQLDEASRLSPRDPNLWSFMILRAWGFGCTGRFEEAAEWSQRAAAQPNSVLWPQAVLTSALGHLGRVAEARQAARRFSAENPDKDILAMWDILPFRDPSNAALMAEGVRRALAGG